jgi:WD40 repeat protein
VGVGSASLTLSFDAWKEGNVAPSRHQVEVVAPRTGLNPEAVSARFKGALIHPNRKGVLKGLRYSPDGKRLIAGDYPGGTIQVWDTQTGKELTKIETGYGYRSSADYFFLTPDWRAVFVSRQKRQHARLDRDGKKLIRWECDGEVRAWDPGTGALRETYQHSPPRGIHWLELAPDGSTFVTFEELSGEVEGPPNRAASLWDVRTKQPRPLPVDLQPVAVYAPDGKSLAAQATDEKQRVTAIKLIDVATAREKLAIPITEKGAQRIGFMDFAPGGKLLVGQVRDETNTGQHWLKFWDAATGRELTSFTGEKQDYFLWMTFSPDGRTLAVTNAARGEPGKLFLFDLPGRKLVKTITLGEKATVHRPAFSLDGKWLAVATQVFPDEFQRKEPAAEDVPQPRIHLVEVVADAVRETLIAPPGFTTSLCFSPDGRTLATSGNGRVLLWDLTKPPLGAGAGGK